MAAFQFPSAAQKPQTAAREERKPAEFWGNVGKTLMLPVGPDGAEEAVFISLGGIAFDNIEDSVVRSNSTDRWAIIAAAKNELLKILRSDMATLEKGQAGVHPMLEVEIRRAGEAVAPQTPENVVSIVAAAMGKGIKAA